MLDRELQVQMHGGIRVSAGPAAAATDLQNRGVLASEVVVESWGSTAGQGPHDMLSQIVDLLITRIEE